MARHDPTSPAEFRRIPGQKLKDFAAPFLTAIAEFLTTNPRQSSAPPNDTSAAAKTRELAAAMQRTAAST